MEHEHFDKRGAIKAMLDGKVCSQQSTIGISTIVSMDQQCIFRDKYGERIDINIVSFEKWKTPPDNLFSVGDIVKEINSDNLYQIYMVRQSMDGSFYIYETSKGLSFREKSLKLVGKGCTNGR